MLEIKKNEMSLYEHYNMACIYYPMYVYVYQLEYNYRRSLFCIWSTSQGFCILNQNLGFSFKALNIKYPRENEIVICKTVAWDSLLWEVGLAPEYFSL